MNEPADELAGPRGFGRILDWAADRLEHIPPEAWPFILLALFAVAANGHAVLSSGSLPLLLLANIAAGALLPAAILIGCRDAWRSARLVLVGAIVWTSIPYTVDVVSSTQQWLSVETLTDTSIVSGLEIARELAGLFSLAGPALVAIGLIRTRRTQTTWPRALVALALIVTAMFCVYGASSAMSQYATLQSFSGTTLIGSFRDQLFVAVVALQPVRILTVGALAWSTLSAVGALEEPHRFWLSVFAGSAVLIGLTVLSLAFGLAGASGALAPDTYGSLLGQFLWVEGFGGLIGMVLLLVGFGIGLPTLNAGEIDEAVVSEAS